jgi:carbon-monoxide dehydrogenase large subunit
VDLEACTLAIVRHAVVHDSGRSINPMIVEGQVHGGTAQGLGSALLEEVVHDGQGQLVTGSLMDYALPRAADFPTLDVVHVEFPSTVNELGIKGVGESGVIAPGAMIAGAVEDALADYGAEITRLPVTPARVFDALRATGRWPVPASRPQPSGEPSTRVTHAGSSPGAAQVSSAPAPSSSSREP